MKKMIALFGIVALTAFSGLQAQITFMHGTLQEALDAAKKQKKPLFVDVYAEWCGPCKVMARTAFMDSAVGRIYNASFISLKLDGEKNDGPEVMQKFGITAYPTLLYFNADGTLATKVVGGQNAQQLINRAETVLHPERNPLNIARKTYFDSKKTRVDLGKYIVSLHQLESDSTDFYTKQFIAKFPDPNLDVEGEWLAFYYQIHDYQQAPAQYFLASITRFNTDMARNKLGMFLQQAFQSAAQQGEFEPMEKAARAIYPYFEVLNTPNLPGIEPYIEFLKNEFSGQ